jgi:hypothetical protein
MADNDKDCGRSSRPSTEKREWSSICCILGGRTIERLGDTVYALHRAQGDKEHGFLDLASKPRSTISFGLVSKSMVFGFPVCASKPVATI